MPQADGYNGDDDVPEGGVSETPCFDRLFARYATGTSSLGTEDVGRLLLDMGFSCAPRVVDRALDDMDPDATGEIAKLTFLEWFEAHADEIDVPSGRPSGGRSPRRVHLGGEESDDGAITQLTSAMLEARNERKCAESDVQVLSNRLMHLRAEEAKAQRRIEEANRRAQEIEAARRRNAEHQRAKQRANEELQLEIKRTHDYNQLVAASARHRKLEIVSAISASRAQVVMQTRAERASHLQRIRLKRDAEQRQLAGRSKEIRSQELSALLKRDTARRQHEQELLRSTRDKLASEHERTLQQQQLIEQLERQEATLLDKLRGSHERQRAAYERLEAVVQDSP